MLRIGIIGSNFGVVGLIPSFAFQKKCKVIAVCAKKSENLDNVLKKLGPINIYTDWKLLLKKEKLDAIAIAVVPKAQYQITKVAILKGINVFAEKPLAVNLSEARELLSLAKKMKITHGIDFMFTEISEWKKVKRIIDDKILGKLNHISVNWDWLSRDIKYKKASWKTNAVEGGGVLSFIFSHSLHYLEHFAGKIKKTKSLFVYSPRSVNGGEVGIDILLQFKNGVGGYAHLSSVSEGMVKHKLVFQCENGVIVLENENAIVNNFSIKMFSKTGVKNIKVIKDKDVSNEDERVKLIRKLAVRFVRACIKKEQTSPSFIEGVRVQELIHQIRVEKI